MHNIKNIHFFDRLQHVPVAFSGIALGIGGLGNAWMNLYPDQVGWLKYVTIPIVIILLILLFTKNVVHPKVVLKELKEPLLSSFLPTFCMCLMLIAGFCASFDKNPISAAQIIGSIIMCVSILVQFILIFTFSYFVIKNHQWHNHPMYGSWFVPTVGLITACTVAPNFSALPSMFFQIIWFIGFALYVLTFVPITYSLLFKTKAQEDRYPSIAVYFAPANLTPSGFMQAFWFADGKVGVNGIFHYNGIYDLNFIFAMLLIMLPFGLVMSFILYTFLLRIFKTKFSFVYASLSFPLAISATTIILFYKMTLAHSFQVVNNPFISTMSWASFIIGNIFVICASVIIIFIFIKMLILLFKLFKKNKQQDSSNNNNNNTNNNLNSNQPILKEQN